MEYAKKPLSFDEQADQLIQRGLGGDRDTIIKRLRDVNYYRLSAYWYPYRNPDNTLNKEACFDTIWDRYVFDRQLRLLVMDAIERIEISIRTRMTNLLTLNYVRNLCAHHARLWNREFAVRPILPAKKSHPDWHDPEISSHRIFAALTLLYFMLKKIAPQSGWADRLDGLLKRHPDIPLEDMGFIADWKNHPLWTVGENDE